MTLNIGAINRRLRGEKRIRGNDNAEIWAKKGGWSDVILNRNGETIRIKLRTPKARTIAASGKMKFSKVEDRLYSEWIQHTHAGALHTARRQVEGMLKTAMRKGDLTMAEELQQVLGRSDESVKRFYDNWTKTTSDSKIEEFYSYDVSNSGFPELLDELVKGNGGKGHRVR